MFQTSLQKFQLFIGLLVFGGLIFFLLNVFGPDKTWESKKVIYQELIELVGKISANSENIEELQTLKPSFDEFYDGKMIFAESGDEALLQRMMSLKTHYESQLEGKTDFYQQDKLKQASQKLVKQLNTSISYGDNAAERSFYWFLGYLVVIVAIKFLGQKLLKQRELTHLPHLSQEERNQFKGLVGKGDTGKVIKDLNERFGQFASAKRNEFITLKASHDEIRKRILAIDDPEDKRELAKLTLRLLTLIDELPEKST
ncbi:MAG: hypothetical protein AAF388_15935 [Bacteroidota bacterium]